MAPHISDGELQDALRDPSGQYDTPADVVQDTRFNRAQKLEILTRWEVDARALQVAEEENMPGGEDTSPTLEQVLRALAELDAGETMQATPTKLG